jgi:hypothetical protein
MDIEEARARLRGLGIPVGGWSEADEKEVCPPFLEEQKKLLGQLELLLEEQIKQDQQQVADLHLALQRAKFGGGQSRG